MQIVRFRAAGKTRYGALEGSAVIEYSGTGYTCLSDVAARDIQARDQGPTRAKAFDTFCPVGPS